MQESSIQSSIRKYLKKEGWFVTKLILTSTAGIPDLLAIKDGRHVFIEVKSDRYNKAEEGLSPLQIARIAELRSYGAEIIIAKSVHEITKTL